MIFPSHCKCVGYASEKPVGDKVYFLSEYLIHKTPEGYEILHVKAGEGSGLMREVEAVTCVAGPSDVCMYPDRVILHNRGDLIRRALSTGMRCTVFTGIDEHMTFVCDPDPSALVTIHVYDIMPPRPNLAGTIQTLDEAGLFGELEITFCYHIRDIREIGADVYPCKAAGFTKTIDTDRLSGDEQIAGCLIARQVLSECYGRNFPIIDIFPSNQGSEKPFIARCCRAEHTGASTINGKRGIIVHWGSSPKQIADAVFTLMKDRRNE
jgi:hypothetical protein